MKKIGYYLKQQKSRSLISLASLLLLLVVLLISSRLPLFTTLKSNSQQTAVIHYADHITPTLNRLIEKFNEENEGRIRVAPINIPFSKFSTNERKELLARSLRSKSDRLDIFAVDLIWVYRFAKWAEPLGKYFSTVQRSEAISHSIQSCYYKGELVAMPLKIDVGTMYYRKDLVERMPNSEELKKKLAESITWNEFIALGTSLDNLPGPFYTFPAAEYEGVVCSFIEAILNQNREFFYKDEIDLNKQEARLALNLLVDLVNQYDIAPDEVTHFTEYMCHEYYIKNDGLFLRSWPTFLSDYRTIFADSAKHLEFVRVPLPHFEDTKHANIFGGWNLMISSFSQHKKEAVEFINFLMDENSQIELYKEDGSLPILKSIYENYEEHPNPEVLKFYNEQFEYGVHRPSSEDYTRISDIISHFVNKAVKKEISVNEALEEATEMIKSGKVIIN